MSKTTHSLHSFENIHPATTDLLRETEARLNEQVRRTRQVRRIAPYKYVLSVNSHNGPVSVHVDISHHQPTPHIALTYSTPSWSQTEIKHITLLTNTILTKGIVASLDPPRLKALTIECLTKTNGLPEEILLRGSQDYYPEIDDHFRDRHLIEKRLTLSCHIESGRHQGKQSIKTQVHISSPIVGMTVPLRDYYHAYNQVGFYGTKNIDWESLSKPESHRRGIFEVALKSRDLNEQLSAIIQSSTKLNTAVNGYTMWRKLTRPIEKLTQQISKHR